jgi:hypothetical protein
MDERSVLQAHIVALEQELSRAKATLLLKIDPNLRKRLEVRFNKLFNDQSKALESLRKLVERGASLSACWSSYQRISQECKPLFQECLVLTQGALARRENIDNGLCRIADTLLDDLSHRTDIQWGRFTILAEEEFFTHMAQVVRLRFPEVGVWNLPVAAHEFGHYVGPKLEIQESDGMSSHPFQDVVRDETRSRGEQHSYFVHEYFADLFATYSLGPAYACTCILLRFDLSEAYTEGEYHPSAATRVYWILRVLEKMDKAQGGVTRPYRGIIRHLEQIWRSGLAATDQQEYLNKDVTNPIDALLRKLYQLVDRAWPDVRYRSWARVVELSSQLLSDKEPEQVLTDADRLPDLINAAWRCRLVQKGQDVDMRVRKIGDRTVQFCNHVIDRAG